MDYGDEAQCLEHIPDLLIRFDDGIPWLVEFKTDDDPHLPFAMARARLLRQPLLELGFRYLVVLWSTLKSGSYLANATWLRRYGNMPLNLVQRERAKNLFVKFGELCPPAFCTGFGTPGEGRRVLAALMKSGEVDTDMNRPIDEESVLRWCEFGTGDESWLSAAFGVTK
ncbi:MAG: hypothetical protein KDJ14_03620 [Xanthomonadales bacterium]|nr:hypothetical protein [Xanthomonadales bacterium]